MKQAKRAKRAKARAAVNRIKRAARTKGQRAENWRAEQMMLAMVRAR